MRETCPSDDRAAGRLGWIALLVVLVLVVAYAIPNWVRPGCGRGRVRWDRRQKAQLDAIGVALERFRTEHGDYPLSDANDPTGLRYCGAMILAKTLVNQDQDSRGGDLDARKRPYLEAKNAGVFKLVDICDAGNTQPFPPNTIVLCDVYRRGQPGGAKAGLPILYYRANRSGTAHDANHPDDPNNIYDHADNEPLLALVFSSMWSIPSRSEKTHPLIDPKRFYLNTQDVRVKSSPQPCRADSYILISAGWDGLYGTADDICNFEWKYREQ